MALLPGKIFIPENVAQLREQILSDLRLEAFKYGIEDPPTTPGTDNYIRATEFANQLYLIYSSLAIRDSQRNIRESTGEDLNLLLNDYGLKEVNASPGSGRVIVKVNGTASIPDGTEYTYSNGKRGKVVGLQLGVINGDSIPVIGIDTGEDTNFSSGTIKFVNPPLNVSVEATVDPANPITGGTDQEDDERKRTRILNKLQNPPAGGNWSHFVQASLEANASVQYAFIYPALGGPGSVKIVVVRDFDSSYSRIPGAGLISEVDTFLRTNFPTENQVVVTGPGEQDIDVAIKVNLPSAAISDIGWTNINVWPNLVAADAGRVTILSVTSSTNITISANTTAVPENGITEIMAWNNTDKAWIKSKVLSSSGVAGARVLMLETPLTGIGVGSFICPSAVNADSYKDTWIEALSKLGPGENTEDQIRIMFGAFRHPTLDEDWPSTISAIQLTELVNNHPEFSSIDYSYISQSSPTIPASVSDPPQILTPGRFGIYKV